MRSVVSPLPVSNVDSCSLTFVSGFMLLSVAVWAILSVPLSCQPPKVSVEPTPSARSLGLAQDSGGVIAGASMASRTGICTGGTFYCSVYADHAMPTVLDAPRGTVHFDDLGRDDSHDRVFSGDSRAPVNSLPRPHRVTDLTLTDRCSQQTWLTSATNSS